MRTKDIVIQVVIEIARAILNRFGRNRRNKE